MIPPFAQGFPKGPEVDALLQAFNDGDYRQVQTLARQTLRESKDPAVRDAANVLLNRLRPDPIAVVAIVVTALLLLFLTLWWTPCGGPKRGFAPTLPLVAPPSCG